MCMLLLVIVHVFNFCFLFRLGDQLLSVNDVSLLNVTHNDAVDALRNAGLTVKLVSLFSLSLSLSLSLSDLFCLMLH